jgi:hypothetical protein
VYLRAGGRRKAAGRLGSRPFGDLLDGDEAVRAAIATVFARFADFHSVRQVWMWLRSEGIQFPLRRFPGEQLRWVEPSYHGVQPR